MISAYVLVEGAPGKNVKNVRDQIRSVPGVESAELVTGPYDIVVKIKGKDMSELSKVVTDKILATKGVGKTITLVIIS
jgi:DNA-binding Lrp family transcriptional regulator